MLLSQARPTFARERKGLVNCIYKLCPSTPYVGVSLFTGVDYWTGLLDWTTGLDYWTDLFATKKNFYAL